MVVYFDPYSSDGSVHVRNRYLCVRQPKTVCATGLFDSFQRALAFYQLDEQPSKLIGFGCDGANVNIGGGGVRGLIQSDRPWVITVWCLAHRLELALKDALSKTYFSVVDEFLLRLYYLYHKSPKKCKELEDMVSTLKECLSDCEFPAVSGIRPMRACGTRFVTHKVSALERIIDRFGAYMNHLVTLTESSSTKAADKQKLTGYIKKWRECKLLLACALFHDLLKPVAVLCKSLQSDEISVVSAIECILKTSSTMEKLNSTDVNEYPSVRKVISRFTDDDTGSTMYQGTKVVRKQPGLDFLKSNYKTYIECVLGCLHDRFKDGSTDTALLGHALKVVATHGWHKSTDASFGIEGVKALADRFTIPLQKANVNSALLLSEWEEMVYYAKEYINIVQEPYRVVWWKLFNADDAKNWTNILALIELIFCFPLSNGRVEICFSQLKLIKTIKRTSLGEDRLDELLRIKLEGPPLAQWDPTNAVGLWWRDKTRRTETSTSGPRKRNVGESTKLQSTENVEFDFSLSDWDNWLESSDSSCESDSNCDTIESDIDEDIESMQC